MDILRGSAAAAVVMHHASGFYWRHPSAPASIAQRALAFPGFGYLGVSLFFIISGFCIHLPHAGDPDLEARRFLVRRFWRIYPPYFAAVLIVATSFWINFGSARHGDWLLKNVAANLFFWHYADGPSQAGMGLSPVFWTVAIEVQFYLLYLLTFPLIRRVGISRLAVVLVVAGIAYRLVQPHLFSANYGIARIFNPEHLSPARFGEWLLGAWIAQSLSQRTLPTRWHAVFVVTAGSASVLIAAFVMPYLPGGLALVTAAASIGFAMILAALASWEIDAAQPANPLNRHVAVICAWLADRSYSLYLIHFTVIASIGVVAAQLLHIADRDRVGGTPSWLGVTLAGVVASFVAADLLYRIVEAPSHAFARGFSSSIHGRRNHWTARYTPPKFDPDTRD